ncbi:formate/nitrite transporter [Kipferlia bialata]|uniref:Formate/nitrite transporter n=1 Tax=Kipferlia bialata TaxID=797122 RepID=A0A9K3D1I0_9EUKA|nr:formate/nitrite transporter [Kipferlia bialata]|eukprot:g9268.t1
MGMSTLASGTVVQERLEAAGVAKCSHTFTRTTFSGFLSGVFLGFGAILAITVGKGNITSSGISKLLFGGLFPVGLMMIIFTGTELFTGDCLVITPAMLKKKVTPKQIAKLAVAAYLGNFIGCVAAAYFFGHRSGIFDSEPYASAVVAIGVAKGDLSIEHMILRSIACNWLVCIAVFCVVATSTVAGKVLVIWWIIGCFAMSGFEHSIANMFFLALSYFHQETTELTLAAAAKNLFWVTFGNIIGGMFICAFGYYYMYPTQAKSDNVMVLSVANDDSAVDVNEK